jgi:hypothetical protein
VDNDDLLVDPNAVTTANTRAPSKWAGKEYWPVSNVTIGVLSGTARVRPSTSVYAVLGTRCNRGCSSLSITAGLRLVARCSRGVDLDHARIAGRFDLSERAVLGAKR